MPAPIILLAALTVFGLVRGDDDPKKVVDPLETVESLWDKGTLVKGGAAAADGSILFSDAGVRIMRFNPSTGETSVFRQSGGRTNDMIVDRKGRLIVAEGAGADGGRRVSVIDLSGKRHTLAGKYDGKRFNGPDAVAIDDDEHVYFTDPRAEGSEARELGFEGVFRVDDDGDDLKRLKTTAKKPNGLVVSPDGETLYVSDNGPERRALLAVDLDDVDDYDEDDADADRPDGDHADGVRVLVDFGEGPGIEGMTITADGRIIAAMPDGVAVFSPKGEKLALISTPEAVANVEFGGEVAPHILYITAGKSLYRVNTKMRGYHVPIE